MRLLDASMAALAAALTASPALSCPAASPITTGCTLPLTVVNDGDGFTIVPRGSMDSASVARGSKATETPLPHRLGGAVWFDDRLARLLAMPSGRPEPGQ